jgi:hypothetical protein
LKKSQTGPDSITGDMVASLGERYIKEFMDRIKSFLGLFPKYLSNSLIVG